MYLSPWFFALTLALILTCGLWFARGALIIGIVIAVSLIGTFVVLHMLGRSLNVISLAGLAFAVGMLVDNAIVVLENIYRRYQLGETPPHGGGARHAGGVGGRGLLDAGQPGRLPADRVREGRSRASSFMDISLAISAAVGLSLVVAATVVPVAAARLLRKQGPEAPQQAADPALAQLLARGANPEIGTSALGDNGEPITNGDGRLRDGEPAVSPGDNSRNSTVPIGHSARFFAWLYRVTMEPLQHGGEAFVRWVGTTNAWLLATPLRGVTFIVALLGACCVLLWVLWPKVEYLPAGNRNLVIAIVLPPPGYNLDQLMSLGDDRSKKGSSRIGTSIRTARRPPELDAPVIGDFFFVARGRQVFLGVRAHDPDEAGKLVPMISGIASKLPGTFAVVKQTSLFEQGLMAGRTVDIEITGPELTKLVELGGQSAGHGRCGRCRRRRSGRCRASTSRPRSCTSCPSWCSRPRCK